jgi:hypothetical protein
VAEAHKADLETQGKYGVSYLRYWVDEEAGKILCLVERMTQKPRAPSTAKHMDWSQTRSSPSANTADTPDSKERTT